MFRMCAECLHKSAISELFGAWLGGQPQRCLWSSSVLLRSRKSAGKSGSSSSSSDSDSDSDRPGPGAGVDSKLREAAENLARSVPPSRSRGLQGDLLQQLQSVSRLAQDQAAAGATPQSAASNNSKAATRLSDLLGQMQVQKPRGRQGDEESVQTRPRGGSPPVRRQVSRADREKVKLFEGPALGIFTSGKAARTAEHKEVVAESGPSLWDEVSREQLEMLRRQPPSNTFEEMIQWTQEGKMWTYPINNEQGLEEEGQVGFHQHVFLEDQIADFPRRGPLRHFMELVVVGLAKNPYLSVQQKHQHIDWFRHYFREKEDVLREALGDDGVMAQSQ